MPQLTIVSNGGLAPAYRLRLRTSRPPLRLVGDNQVQGMTAAAPGTGAADLSSDPGQGEAFFLPFLTRATQPWDPPSITAPEESE